MNASENSLFVQLGRTLLQRARGQRDASSADIYMCMDDMFR